VNARTSGIYVRATAADLATLDGSDTAQRVKLIADRVSHWKEITAT
jgi:vacuolar-type H+-ATPase catalytic subunit A/Vma1